MRGHYTASGGSLVDAGDEAGGGRHIEKGFEVVEHGWGNVLVLEKALGDDAGPEVYFISGDFAHLDVGAG